jgi:zinc protease
LPKNAEGMEAAIKAIMDEQERLIRFGFTKGELERAKKEYMVGIDKGFKEKDKTKSANFVNGFVQNYLQGSAFTNADFRYEFAQKQLEDITLAEVNAITKKVVKEENRVGLIVGSEKDKEKLPDEAKLKELLSYKNPDLKPLEEEVALTPILEKIPEGTKVVSEKKIDEIGVTELVFANGVKVALKPTIFKNDQIVFSASSKGGTSLYNDADYFSAELASTIMSQGGVSKLSDTQLDKALAGKVAQVYTYVGELTEGLGGNTTPKDLETALQLMHAYATQPRRDDEVVKNFLKNEKELLANSIKTLTPEKVFGDTVTTILYQNHFLLNYYYHMNLKLHKLHQCLFYC